MAAKANYIVGPTPKTVETGNAYFFLECTPQEIKDWIVYDDSADTIDVKFPWPSSGKSDRLRNMLGNGQVIYRGNDAATVYEELVKQIGEGKEHFTPPSGKSPIIRKIPPPTIRQYITVDKARVFQLNSGPQVTDSKKGVIWSYGHGGGGADFDKSKPSRPTLAFDFKLKTDAGMSPEFTPSGEEVYVDDAVDALAQRAIEGKEIEIPVASVSVRIANYTKKQVQLIYRDRTEQAKETIPIEPNEDNIDGGKFFTDIPLVKGAPWDPKLDLNVGGATTGSIKLKFEFSQASKPTEKTIGVEGCYYRIDRPDAQSVEDFGPRGSYHLNNEGKEYTSTINNPHGRYSINFEVLDYNPQN